MRRIRLALEMVAQRTYNLRAVSVGCVSWHLSEGERLCFSQTQAVLVLIADTSTFIAKIYQQIRLQKSKKCIVVHMYSLSFLFLCLLHFLIKLASVSSFKLLIKNINLDRTRTKPTGIPPETHLQGDRNSLINTPREQLSNQL